MKGILFVVCLATVLVAGIWAAALGRVAAASTHEPTDALTEAAYPDEADRAGLYVRAHALSDRVAKAFARLPGTPGPRVRRLLLRAATRADFTLQALLVFIPAFAGAVALGSCRREAARTLVKFSSPTAAFAAKKLFFAALVALAVFAMTPMAVPYWFAYAALAVMTLTTSVYVENIPVKI